MFDINKDRILDYKTREKLLQILSDIRRKGNIDYDARSELTELFSEELVLRAVHKVDMGNIIHIKFIPSGRSLWMCRGRKRNYILYPGRFCSCTFFFVNVVGKGKKCLCKHLLALELFKALKKDNIESVEVKDIDFKGFIKTLIYPSYL